jgi:hypothetical protein
MKENNLDSLQPTVKGQGINTSSTITSVFSDILKDFGEIGSSHVIKKLTENELISSIPVVNTFVGVVKSGIAIKDWHYFKKLCRFLVEFESANYDISQLEKYRIELVNDKKKSMVIEHLIVMLDRINYENKVTVLAKLFQAYLNKENGLTWERFVALTICLESLNPEGYLFLHSMSERNWSHQSRPSEGEILLLAAGIGSREGTKFTVVALGRELYNYGIKYVISDIQNECIDSEE